MARRTGMRRPVQGPDAAPLSPFRTALVNRLRAARSYTVVTVVAPLGYGKTTLLSQWAARDDRAFLRLDDGGLDARWAAAAEPALLVVDDADLLDDKGAARVARLISQTPPGSAVVLAGRSLAGLPNLSLARLRAAGRLLELGPRDLAMSRREANALLKAHGTHASERELSDLLDRTEGWAAGIAHAAASRELHGPATLDGNGITRAFFREECLAGLTPALRTFLRRTSVLDRMSAALCDAVMKRSGSARELETLDRLGLFLVPLDHRGEWYRLHHLLRRELASDLAESEPELVPLLHGRASAWFEAHQDAAGALDHARRAGEPDSFRRVFGTRALDAHDSGRDPEVEDWLAYMDNDGDLARSPLAAVLAARLHAHQGRLEPALRSLAAAEKGARRRQPVTVTRPARARIHLVRAALCAGGADQMLSDAKSGVAGLGREDPWYAYGLLLQGIAQALIGEPGQADAILGRAAHAAERTAATETRILALSERALLAEARGAPADATAQLARALDVARRGGLERYGTVALAIAQRGQAELRNGRWRESRATLAQARALTATLTGSLPWLAVQVRLELAHAHVMLRDADAARALLSEIDSLCSACPGLGLRAQRDRLARAIGSIPVAGTGQTARLTGAELRLLPLLGTHLSFREIGARLYLSRHTVKTQAISAYRKLGASSRKEAVMCATSLGLIETTA
jgi:LuxR family transcriptional regulator, maltose regulon positive regulatory protein